MDDGAILGFEKTLSEPDAEAYWREVIDEMEPNSKALLVATSEDGRVAGSVQLVLQNCQSCTKQAEVIKLMVHRDFRRQGLATRLMDCLHDLARTWGVKEMVLVTGTGEPSELLYKNMGYKCYDKACGHACGPSKIPCNASFYQKQL